MKFQVIIKTVSPRNQSRISPLLSRILGQGAGASIKKLVKDGGVVSNNLTKAEADQIYSSYLKTGILTFIN